MHAIILIALLAAPFDGPSPATTGGTWSLASWVDPVRKRGWTPMDPALRFAHQQAVTFLPDSHLLWGDEMSGTNCPLGVPHRVSRGSYEFTLCDGLPKGKWTWLARDRAQVELPSGSGEFVRLNPGESLEKYIERYYSQLAAKAWPRLAGRYVRDGRVLLVRPGEASFEGQPQGSLITECLTSCSPDAGSALCIESSRDVPVVNEQNATRTLWAFTTAPDGGVTAWATSNDFTGLCALAPAAQTVEPVPLLRVQLAAAPPGSPLQSPSSWAPAEWILPVRDGGYSPFRTDLHPSDFTVNVLPDGRISLGSTMSWSEHAVTATRIGPGVYAIKGDGIDGTWRWRTPDRAILHLREANGDFVRLLPNESPFSAVEAYHDAITEKHWPSWVGTYVAADGGVLRVEADRTIKWEGDTIGGYLSDCDCAPDAGQSICFKSGFLGVGEGRELYLSSDRRADGGDLLMWNVERPCVGPAEHLHRQ